MKQKKNTEEKKQFPKTPRKKRKSDGIPKQNGRRKIAPSHKDEPDIIGESKNKEFFRTKKGKKVIIISKDKKTNETKELTYKQYQSNKKKWNILPSSRELNEAWQATNQNLDRKLLSLYDQRKVLNPKTKDKGNYAYKKYAKYKKNGKVEIRYLKIDYDTGKPIKSYSFKQAINIFRKYKDSKEIRLLVQSGYTVQEARKERARRKKWAYNAQITNIQKQHEMNKTDAIAFYNSLKRRNRFDIIASYTYDTTSKK